MILSWKEGTNSLVLLILASLANQRYGRSDLQVIDDPYPKKAAYQILLNLRILTSTESRSW